MPYVDSACCLPCPCDSTDPDWTPVCYTAQADGRVKDPRWVYFLLRFQIKAGDQSRCLERATPGKHSGPHPPSSGGPILRRMWGLLGCRRCHGLCWGRCTSPLLLFPWPGFRHTTARQAAKCGLVLCPAMGGTLRDSGNVKAPKMLPGFCRETGV